MLPAHIGAPRASNVGLLGAELAKAGRAIPAAEVELRYLRASDAEAQLNRDTPRRN